MDSYRPERDISAQFLETVEAWMEESEDVLVVLRYLRAAGAKDFVLCNSFSEFEKLVDWAPIGTDIEVFRGRQLPIRGIVTPQLATDIDNAIPPGEEYLILTPEKLPDRPVSKQSFFDNDRDSLKELLQELMGIKVAVGLCPNFVVPDHEGLISASKGGIDGAR